MRMDRLEQQVRDRRKKRVGWISVVVGCVFALSWASTRAVLADYVPGVHEEDIEENVHKPRHGGYFGDADDIYHYEVLVEASGRVVLYVNDEYNRPQNVEPLRARLTLNPDAEYPFVGRFEPGPDGEYFIARLPVIVASPIHLQVEVEKDGQWAPMEFTIPIDLDVD